MLGNKSIKKHLKASEKAQMNKTDAEATLYWLARRSRLLLCDRIGLKSADFKPLHFVVWLHHSG